MGFLRRNKHIIFLVMCILTHTIILFYFCNFDRTISTNDEMSYYEGARSIFHGRGVQLHSLDLNLKNLAYVYFLVPFFNISSTIGRIKMITFVQSFLLSFCALPVWLICKELGLKEKYRWAAVIVIFLWPDNLTACTLASENLYWPLFACSLYLWVKTVNSRKWQIAACCAIIHFLTYFCKEVGICLPLAYVGYAIVFPIIEKLGKFHSNKQTQNSYNEHDNRLCVKDDIKLLLIYLAVYFACYVIVNHIILAGVNNLYNSKMNFSFIHDMYAVIFCLYGIIYYLVAATVAFLILPVLYPSVNYGSMWISLRKAYCYWSLLFLGMILVIACTITVKEDIGMLIPRVHMRYMAPMVCILFPIFFGLMEENEKHAKSKKKMMLVIIVLFCLLSIGLFKGTSDTGSVAAHLTLVITDWLKVKYPQLVLNDSSTFIVYPYAIVINAYIIVILVSWYAVNYFQRLHRFVLPFTVILMCVVCVANWKTGYNQLYRRYKNNDVAVQEMQIINDYFAGNVSEEVVVLMVCSDWRSAVTRVYDTYFDYGTNYMCHYDVLNHTLSEMQTTVEETVDIDLFEPIRNRNYHLERVDYIIIGDSLGDLGGMLDGFIPVEELMGNYYVVYENLDPYNFMQSGY